MLELHKSVQAHRLTDLVAIKARNLRPQKIKPFEGRRFGVYFRLARLQGVEGHPTAAIGRAGHEIGAGSERGWRGRQGGHVKDRYNENELKSGAHSTDLRNGKRSDIGLEGVKGYADARYLQKDGVLQGSGRCEGRSVAIAKGVALKKGGNNTRVSDVEQIGCDDGCWEEKVFYSSEVLEGTLNPDWQVMDRSLLSQHVLNDVRYFHLTVWVVDLDEVKSLNTVLNEKVLGTSSGDDVQKRRADEQPLVDLLRGTAKPTAGPRWRWRKSHHDDAHDTCARETFRRAGGGISKSEKQYGTAVPLDRSRRTRDLDSTAERGAVKDRDVSNPPCSMLDNLASGLDRDRHGKYGAESADDVDDEAGDEDGSGNERRYGFGTSTTGSGESESESESEVEEPVMSGFRKGGESHSCIANDLLPEYEEASEADLSQMAKRWRRGLGRGGRLGDLGSQESMSIGHMYPEPTCAFLAGCADEFVGADEEDDVMERIGKMEESVFSADVDLKLLVPCGSVAVGRDESVYKSLVLANSICFQFANDWYTLPRIVKSVRDVEEGGSEMLLARAASTMQSEGILKEGHRDRSEKGGTQQVKDMVVDVGDVDADSEGARRDGSGEGFEREEGPDVRPTKVIDWVEWQTGLITVASKRLINVRTCAIRDAMAERLDKAMETRAWMKQKQEALEERRMGVEMLKADLTSAKTHHDSLSLEISRTQDGIRGKIQQLMAVVKTLEDARRRLKEANNLLAGEGGYGHLSYMRRALWSRRSSMIAQLLSIYPISTANGSHGISSAASPRSFPASGPDSSLSMPSSPLGSSPQSQCKSFATPSPPSSTLSTSSPRRVQDSSSSESSVQSVMPTSSSLNAIDEKAKPCHKRSSSDSGLGLSYAGGSSAPFLGEGSCRRAEMPHCEGPPAEGLQLRHDRGDEMRQGVRQEADAEPGRSRERSEGVQQQTGDLGTGSHLRARISAAHESAIPPGGIPSLISRSDHARALAMVRMSMSSESLATPQKRRETEIMVEGVGNESASIQGGMPPTIAGLPLHVPSKKTFGTFRTHAEKHENEQSATALGYAAHVISLLGNYLDVRPRYPLRVMGSRSWIRDPFPGVDSSVSTSGGAAGEGQAGGRNQGRGQGSGGDASGGVEFPLFNDGKEPTRFAYAVFLLNKDVEQMMNAFGISSLGPRHVIQNLQKLLTSFCSGACMPP